METIVPQLLPFMNMALAVASNGSSIASTGVSSPAKVLQNYLAAMVCQVSVGQCTGAHTQFDSMAECMASMMAMPTGDFDRYVYVR